MSAFSGKTILVTGGTGAFGQKFLRWALQQEPACIKVLSRDEMKHTVLRRDFTNHRVQFVIGDITHREDLERAMSDVDFVVHAAAMKHLPECEFNISASTRVNVQGTENVVSAFLKSKAEILIFLSTDKAPYASSVYGAQKYIGEKLVSEAASQFANKRTFTLRYSNVIDSTGAAFPLFKKLLSESKTVNVNGAQTRRGFVTQAQVLAALGKAMEVARGGETFVLIPQVVRIAELAEATRKAIGKGEVIVAETKGFAGEKESATLIMAEELAVAKEFAELQEPRAILLDFLKRHDGRKTADLPGSSYTLEACPTLSGEALQKFVGALIE